LPRLASKINCDKKLVYLFPIPKASLLSKKYPNPISPTIKIKTSPVGDKVCKLFKAFWIGFQK
jgi:hypothetical protein